MAHEQTIAAYYDRLSRWSCLMSALGRAPDGASVHRALADPRASGRATGTRIHDVIVDHLPPKRAPRVLDAGCGLGGTIMALAPRLGGQYVGITLSPRQARAAIRAVERAGLSRSVEILTCSFDKPPAGPFDLVVAIESFAHSADPTSTLSAIAARCAPGCLLVVVDDMPEAKDGESVELARFKAGWQCPVLWSGSAYRSALGALGASILVDHDLTEECRPRSLGGIRRLEWLNRTLWQVIPASGWRALMDSHYGGLALERLYRSGHVRYRLLIAKLP
jgi:SAM-dependent methyltransferase